MTVSINGTSGIVNDATDLSYTGTLTGGTGVVNLGSGQVYKDASGNVGIGTSSPGTKLHIGSGTSPESLGVTLSRGATSNFYLAYDGTKTFIAGTDSANDACKVGSLSSHPVAFVTGNSERARIDSSGNLLVGQTALNGAGKVEIAYDRASSWGMQIRNTTGTTQATTYIAFKYLNTQTGYIESSGSTTSYVTSSDYRLKEDIAPMTGALAKVASLKPYTYTWKVNGAAGEGFLAHELAEVCPSAVSGEKDAVDADGNPQYQGIDTSFLVATLAAAIQELKAIIDEQATSITALEGTAA